MKNKIIALIVGKNIPHLARLLATFIGGLLLSGPLFSPHAAPLAPELLPAAIEIGAPPAAAIQDGLSVGELVSVMGGILLIWASRLISWFRAKNLDWLARILGPLIGRSIPSALRALLVVSAGMLARFTAQPELAPEALADQPLAAVIGSVLAVFLANFLSATEDAQRNPVDQPRLIARPINRPVRTIHD